MSGGMSHVAIEACHNTSEGMRHGTVYLEACGMSHIISEGVKHIKVNLTEWTMT